MNIVNLVSIGFNCPNTDLIPAPVNYEILVFDEAVVINPLTRNVLVE